MILKLTSTVCRRLSPLLAAVLGGCASDSSVPGVDRLALPAYLPEYTPAGEILRPADFHDWLFVGASLGLGYSDSAKPTEPGVFHNVYVQREAFGAYAATGQFPEQTMFLLALYEPRQRESINRQGFFAGDLVALEASVKDSERFPTGWAYFDFGKDRQSAAAIPQDRCYDCHAAHAAADNVFVQFYPALRAARKLGP